VDVVAFEKTFEGFVTLERFNLFLKNLSLNLLEFSLFDRTCLNALLFTPNLVSILISENNVVLTIFQVDKN
jgi:hypothetical protein